MFKAISSLLASLLLSVTLQANTLILADSTGLPGDHFSLEGALDLFKKAQSPEDFEKLLNQEENHVNNLDLNEDGEIDYIRVIDNVEGDVHAIVLQVPVNEKESQDIAVIEIEKQGAEEAILQIIGDEDIYGDSKIAEPFEVSAESDGKGPSGADYRLNRVIVNVWFWPSVRYIYRPAYRPWVSPWRWATYPRWWSPWRPHPWRYYNTRVVRYRTNYRVVATHRVVRAHRVYTPRRTRSTVVRTRTTTTRVVAGPNGRAVKRTTTTRAAGRNANGKAARRTTTTKTVRRGKNGTVKKSRSSSRTVKRRKNN